MTKKDNSLTQLQSKSVAEAAKTVGVGQFRLLEMFSEKLDLPGALGWESIPNEYEYLLEEFKSTGTPEVTPINEIQNKPPVTKQKRNKAALTEVKTTAVQTNKADAKKLAETGETLQLQNAVKRGQIRGTKRAIVEIQSEQSTYEAIVAARLAQDTASLAAEIAEFTGFNPNEILTEAGIKLPSEIYEDLEGTISPNLHLLDESINAITNNDWLKDVDFFSQMSNLQSLLNLEVTETD